MRGRGCRAARVAHPLWGANFRRPSPPLGQGGPSSCKVGTVGINIVLLLLALASLLMPSYFGSSPVDSRSGSARTRPCKGRSPGRATLAFCQAWPMGPRVPGARQTGQGQVPGGIPVAPFGCCAGRDLRKSLHLGWHPSLSHLGSYSNIYTPHLKTSYKFVQRNRWAVGGRLSLVVFMQCLRQRGREWSQEGTRVAGDGALWGSRRTRLSACPRELWQTCGPAGGAAP